MRLRVEFTAPTAVFVPWNYPHHLHGMLTQAILRVRPSLEGLFHREGFQADGHRYRMLTASWLFPKQARSHTDGLLLEPPIRWWVSSPLSALMEALAVAFLQEPERRLGAAVLTVVNISVEPLPSFAQPVELRTISPIIVSTVEERMGKRHRRFLSPDQPEFWRNLERNLQRKARALFGSAESFRPLVFRPVGQWHSRLVSVQGTQVRAFQLRFWATGDETLLALGYDAGFGERNQQCFGMVSLARHSQMAPSAGGSEQSEALVSP
ncbi:MAG: CRISPR-associated endoribonuclease Cas6 [Candidatus Kapabacteria bacterium]|nr:CRISPR-associated endoribonuclease Cas6 [Candidatus Kapabacteria bacterium]MDW8225993.1 CRISPR-associated endoribonuclease Cas6 [Bacteroidota bacterium]